MTSIQPSFQPSFQTSFRAFELAGWERAAEYYGGSFGGLTAQTAEPVLDATRVGESTRLLDVACGPGYLAGAAASRGATVLGIDFSPAMVAEAQRRYPSLTFQVGDAEALPFQSDTLDAVVMNFGMLHLTRPDTAIAEAHRVLRRGGRYAFTVWAPPDQALAFGIVLKAIEAHGRPDVPLPEGPPMFKFGSADECRTALDRAGFTEVGVRTLPLVWELSSPAALFEAMSKGGVRTAAILRAQTPEALAAIRGAVTQTVEQYAHDGAYKIPVPAVLAVATRED